MSVQIKMNLCCKIIFVLGVIFLLPLTQVSAGVAWSEDWTTSPFDEWVIDSYSYNDSHGFQPNSSFEPIIADGVCTTNTASDFFGVTWSGAHRNSSVAYGTWSFDWVVGPDVDNESYIIVFFLANNTENFHDWTGTKIYGHGMEGYFLIIQSGSKGAIPNNTVRLGTIEGGFTKDYSFPEPITGSHHIDITRTVNGEFNVYWDYVDESTQPIITRTSISVKTCEAFMFGAWIGDSIFDNITVSDTVDVNHTRPTTTTTTTTEEEPTTPAPGFEIELLAFSLITLFFVLRKRRIK